MSTTDFRRELYLRKFLPEFGKTVFEHFIFCSDLYEELLKSPVKYAHSVADDPISYMLEPLVYLYNTNKITYDKFKTLSEMMLSNDEENRVLARLIILTYFKN